MTKFKLKISKLRTRELPRNSDLDQILDRIEQVELELLTAVWKLEDQLIDLKRQTLDLQIQRTSNNTLSIAPGAEKS
jgi:hypothetical protein